MYVGGGVSKMASCTGLASGTRCQLGCLVLHVVSHSSCLYWVPYLAFSRQHFKKKEAARSLGDWAPELIQQHFCHI